MFKLPINTWVRNAAAVFAGSHGAVSKQAEQAGCSRQTVYRHARKIERRLDDSAHETAAMAASHAEIQRLNQVIKTLTRETQDRVRLDKDRQRQLATTAFAMGVSLRQIEDILALLLDESDAKPPDHSTLGRWVNEHAQHAGKVLEVLDAHCAPMVSTVCLDEVFFGGGRRWSGSSRRA
jgi:AcrR family transcriptional regulator